MKRWASDLRPPKSALRLSAAAIALIGSPAIAETPEAAASQPILIGLLASGALAVAAVAWALRVSAASRNASVIWTKKLAEMEEIGRAHV